MLFDTRAAILLLQEVGTKQADAIGQIIGNQSADLLTKTHLNAKTSELRSWLLLAMIAIAGLAVSIIKFF